MKKELTALREQLVNKSQELEVGGTNFLWQSGLLLSKVSLLRGTTSPPRLRPRGYESFRRERGLFSPLERNLSVFVSSSPVSTLALSHPFLLSAYFPATDNREYLTAGKSACEKESASQRKAGC